MEFFCRTSLDRLQLRLLTPIARNLILGSHLASIWDEWVAASPIPELEEPLKDDITSPQVEAAVNEEADTTQRRLIWVPLIEIELLDVLEFDNDRKRMSVIIRSVRVD